ncbi:MAG: hypothetical protein CM1200mP5_1540 [Candidatus Pelagibacterales bacterium]|nr:MAG: hypothetical protein CM1200mP5_1540 [Pelagibacterales bacterium]
MYPNIVKSPSIANLFSGSFTFKKEPNCVNCFSTLHSPLILSSIFSSKYPGPSDVHHHELILPVVLEHFLVPSADT